MPPKPVPKFSEVLEAEHKDAIERIPLTQLRKAIAKNMEAALTVPSAVHMDLIDATHLFDIVSSEKEKIAKEKNAKLTFLPFIIKAVIEALKEYPNFNASYDHERLEIIRKNYYNIGLAAEAPDGLKVIVIKDADKKSIIKLAKEIQELGDKVRNETITLEEMKDSTFTITNIGSLGGGFLAVPIINHPDVAILGIMRIRDMPVVKDGKVKAGKILPFSLVFDHRVNDGAEAVRFGNTLIKYLEDPEFLDML
jgi:pyruvate dehydrogenase E2 component (dihydrolipoamide acetyltransferase)